MARVNYETLGKIIDVDEKDLEFERVTNSIDVVDRDCLLYTSPSPRD